MTSKQVCATQKMVENGGNASKAMIDAGYSSATAKNPSKLTRSKGYLQMLDDLGLTEALIIKSLVEDIKSKQGMRKAELELAAKLRGMMKRSDMGEIKEAEKPIFRRSKRSPGEIRRRRRSRV